MKARKPEAPAPRNGAPISKYMTASPHSIGADQTLEKAHEMMRKHRIRHLPVLAGSRLMGIVSQRDLYLIETLKDVDPSSVKVEEAMTQDVYRVEPDTPLDDVARAMVARKLGCAVVMEGAKVVGVFTTTDALYALVRGLEPRARPARRPPAAKASRSARAR
jgi:acetoin utilization protein AcuB